MKIQISQGECIESEYYLKRRVMKSGPRGAHVNVPKDFIGSFAHVFFEAPVGQFIEHWRKGLKRVHEKATKKGKK